MTASELTDDCVVVQATLNLALDVGVFDLFVLFDDILDLLHDTFECPLSQVCRHLHVLLLALKFDLLNLLHEVSHLDHGGTAALEAIEHFLAEVSIDSVLLEDSDLLDVLGDLGEDAIDKYRYFLLLQISTQNLQLRSTVALRDLHGVQQARCSIEMNGVREKARKSILTANLPFLGETPKITLFFSKRMIVSENSQCKSHILYKNSVRLQLI